MDTRPGTGRSWRAKPDNAAHERDYYRVEIPDTDPNVVETFFAQVENRTSPVIRKVIRYHELPDGEDFRVLIEFVTLLALREPTARWALGWVTPASRRNRPGAKRRKRNLARSGRRSSALPAPLRALWNADQRKVAGYILQTASSPCPRGTAAELGTGGQVLVSANRATQRALPGR